MTKFHKFGYVGPEMENIRHKRIPLKKKIFSRQKWLWKIPLKMWASQKKVKQKVLNKNYVE